MSKLSHLDESGAARMVDVSEKSVTAREAEAEAVIQMSPEAYAAAVEGSGPKGEVLATARIAGIMAAKKTAELIPLCHPLALSSVSLAFEPLNERNALRIRAMVKTSGQTGVEMEALTAASVAALTVYDMIKAVDKASVIETIRLLSKSGGKSGDFKVPQARPRASSGYRAAPGARPAPQALMGEVSAPPAPAPDAARAGLRSFMTTHRLQATRWAKDADVPVSQIYAFLTGRARNIPADSVEKLARAARVRVEDLFGGKR